MPTGKNLQAPPNQPEADLKYEIPSDHTSVQEVLEKRPFAFLDPASESRAQTNCYKGILSGKVIYGIEI